ncbi:protein of unknown function [Bradyrhizobium vignae]|uniref:Uncharacterized protein n=1 Tax=Bradyrhizobium vignae TaxID=1549949 RepID=A0A2U3Q728_9BRAD|nr:protein of unknown function [Bradyrhizobium vignae]
MHCIMAAERNGDPLPKSSWLAAATAYDVLRSSLEHLKSAPASVRIGP